MCPSYPCEKVQRLTRFCNWGSGTTPPSKFTTHPWKIGRKLRFLLGWLFFGVGVVSYCQNEFLVGLLPQKNLKNIILTGNLTRNWCLSSGICQYYSRNMFHCRASWDYDPSTQFVKIPQIHSIFFCCCLGMWGLLTEAASKHNVYFHGGQDLNLIPERGWWQIRPDKSVLGRNGRCCTCCLFKSRSDNGPGVLLWKFFCPSMVRQTRYVMNHESQLKDLCLCKIWILTHQTWDKVEACFSTTHLQYSVRGLDPDKLYRLIIAYYI